MAQLKESQSAHSEDNDEAVENNSLGSRTLFIRDAQKTAIRVFTVDEQRKLTKASYQFLARLMRLEIIAEETMEFIINQLLFSESRFVGIEETKWTIRNTLADNLDVNQLAFLDLVLYQTEDKLSLH